MESKVEFLEKNLTRLYGLIQAADAKVPPILTIDVAMLGVVASLASRPAYWTLTMIILAVIALTPVLVSLLFLYLANFPRTYGPKGSFIYFEGIKSYKQKQYLEEIQKMSIEKLFEDLGYQCHRNAEIASAKYSHIKTSMRALFISFIPWLLLVFLMFEKQRS